MGDTTSDEMRVLVIESDPGFAVFLQSSLRAEGHLVDVASSGLEGAALANGAVYDIVVLDLHLRDTQSTDFLLRLRQDGVTSPILAVGSKLGAANVVRALDAGADEYVTRPVGAEELAARVRALGRRGTPVFPVVLPLENVVINIVTHQAFVGGQPLRLTPKEYALLHMFLRRHGETISRAELLENVWEMHFDPGSNLVDVHVSRLRTKLNQAGARLYIEAVRGAGFTLMPSAPDRTRESDVVA